MATFSIKIHIHAPRDAIWESLANIGSIDRWNPGVLDSYLTGEIKPDPSAARYCDLGGGNFLNESVTHWEPGQHLTMQVYNTNLPFRSVDIHFKFNRREMETVLLLHRSII